MEEIADDREALRHIREGDIDWYGAIVKKYTARIYRYASSRLFDKSETDDIVQKTFIQFYKAIARFDENRDILPYLLEIAKNELKMYYRARRDSVSLDDRLVGETPAAGETAQDLQELLRGVAPEQKKALTMRYEGYSYREIAEVLKRPVNTVKTLIRRARLLLTADKP